MRTCYIAINGIRTSPGNARGWTDEIVSQLNLRTGCDVKAEKFEYSCSALFRWIGQNRRAEELLRKVIEYTQDGWRVVLIGHSNGCDLIARVMLNGARIDSCHLFAPAAFEEDFEIAIAQKMVHSIHIYGSPADRALRAASFTSRFVRWLGLGYGSLGLRGSLFATQFPGIVFDHSEQAFGHSTWFIPGAHMEATILEILTNDNATQNTEPTI